MELSSPVCARLTGEQSGEETSKSGVVLLGPIFLANRLALLRTEDRTCPKLGQQLGQSGQPLIREVVCVYWPKVADINHCIAWPSLSLYYLSIYLPPRAARLDASRPPEEAR